MEPEHHIKLKEDISPKVHPPRYNCQFTREDQGRIGQHRKDWCEQKD